MSDEHSKFILPNGDRNCVTPPSRLQRTQKIMPDEHYYHMGYELSLGTIMAATSSKNNAQGAFKVHITKWG